ncbi:hypothetical protein [Photobacterium minamisatsumaniensis]|uniref:hypothetical protein n=1 Tax=Photobacterium minamisatsumaniensis TaxID=2910233 RepID=UPI003D152FCB
MKNAFIASTLYLISCNTLADITVVDFVYMAHRQNMETVNEHRAIHAPCWKEYPELSGCHSGNQLLLPFLEGVTIEDSSSTLISTSSNLGYVIRQASFEARLAVGEEGEDFVYDPDFTHTIYKIKPFDFYDVTGTLEDAITNSSGEQKNYLEALLRYFDFSLSGVGRGAELYVNYYYGLDHTQIKQYATITGEMLIEHGVEDGSILLNPSFWDDKWVKNTRYNFIFEDEQSKPSPYIYPLGYNDRHVVEFLADEPDDFRYSEHANIPKLPLVSTSCYTTVTNIHESCGKLAGVHFSWPRP